MIENTISLGNILTIIAILVSAGAAYAELRSGIRSLKEKHELTVDRLDKIEVELRLVNAARGEQVRLDERINGLEQRFVDFRKAMDDELARYWDKLLHRARNRVKREPRRDP